MIEVVQWVFIGLIIWFYQGRMDRIERQVRELEEDRGTPIQGFVRKFNGDRKC